MQDLKTQLFEAIQKYSYRQNYAQPFSLVSGKKSPHYFDLKQTLLQPQFLAIAGELLFKKIEEVFQNDLPVALAGLTMGADPLIYATSLYAHHNNIPLLPIIVRKASKEHGSQKRAEGRLSKVDGQTTVLIDDVITTGGSTLQAHQVLLELDIQPKHAFCIVDRLEGGSQALQKKSVFLHSLFTLEDFS